MEDQGSASIWREDVCVGGTASEGKQVGVATLAKCFVEHMGVCPKGNDISINGPQTLC